MSTAEIACWLAGRDWAERHPPTLADWTDILAHPALVWTQDLTSAVTRLGSTTAETWLSRGALDYISEHP